MGKPRGFHGISIDFTRKHRGGYNDSVYRIGDVYIYICIISIFGETDFWSKIFFIGVKLLCR